MFIGSFNVDQRSAELNTEIGFVIDSAGLAQRLSTSFDGRVLAESLRHDIEPGTTAPQRPGVDLKSMLPIEWLL